MISSILDIGEGEKKNWVIAAIQIFRFLRLVNGFCVGLIGEEFIKCATDFLLNNVSITFHLEDLDIGGIRCTELELQCNWLLGNKLLHQTNDQQVCIQ